MAGEVLKTNRDADETIVLYRVPEFQNFGARMREIEEQQYATALSEQKLLDVAAAIKARVDATLEELAKVNPGAAELARQTMAELEAMDEDGSEDSDLDELYVEDGFAEDPQVLEIILTAPLKWTPKTQKRVDDLVAAWPALRSDVLKAVFQVYRDNYDDLRSVYDTEQEAMLMVPKPTEPAVLEDRFRITAVYLLGKDAIGLSACCTWDDEHGLGIRLKGDTVVEVGDASVAFE